MSFAAGFVVGVFATIFSMALWGIYRLRRNAAAGVEYGWRPKGENHV